MLCRAAAVILVGIDPQQCAGICRIIQIKGSITSHSQDLTIVRIHDYHTDVVSVQIFLGSGNMILHDPLNGGINGSHDGITIFRRLDHTLQIAVIVQIAIFSAVGSYQLTIVILLYTITTLAAVISGKTDEPASQVVIRINSLVLGFKPYTGHALFGLGRIVLFRIFFGDLGLQIQETVHILFGHFLGIYHITAADGLFFIDQLDQFLTIVTIAFYQSIDGGIRILTVGLDDHRIQDQIVETSRGGQYCTVTVYNIAAAECNGTAVIVLLRVYDLLIFFIFFPANGQKYDGKGKQSQRYECKRQRQLSLHVLSEGSVFLLTLRIFLGLFSPYVTGFVHTVLRTRFLSIRSTEPDPRQGEPYQVPL